MLHLMKLSVGTSDPADLRDWQAKRATEDPPLRHRTRLRPKRAAEIVDGGSIYWVIGGRMLVRQRVVDIIEDVWSDGTRCAGLVLDSVLVDVEARPVQPFQGWRYLAPSSAPADLGARQAAWTVDPALPEDMRRQLRELCLL